MHALLGTGVARRRELAFTHINANLCGDCEFVAAAASPRKRAGPVGAVVGDALSPSRTKRCVAPEVERLACSQPWCSGPRSRVDRSVKCVQSDARMYRRSWTCRRPGDFLADPNGGMPLPFDAFTFLSGNAVPVSARCRPPCRQDRAPVAGTGLLAVLTGRSEGGGTGMVHETFMRSLTAASRRADVLLMGPQPVRP